MGFGSDKTGFYKPSAVTVTASGNPLTLQNAKRLRKLTIYGNAVQDGTPSPDAPVEVQLCGDRTGNLLSMIDANPNTIPVKSYSNGIIEVIGEASLSGGRTNKLSDYITLETNQTYTMVSYLVAGQTDSDIYVCLSRREDGTIYRSIEISAEKRFITIAPDENVEVYLGINVAQGNHNYTLRVAIYKGSYTADTMPAYEPYGYKVSGRAEGLNLLSSAWEDGNINIDTGNNEGYGRRIRTADHIKCKPNTVYTFYTPYSVIGVRGYDADKTYVDFSASTSISSTLTFTTSENVEYLRFITQSSDGTQPDKTLPYMLVQGSYTAETMPPYEPYQPPQDFAVYLPEQIAKVGDVADEITLDFEHKTATRTDKIKQLKDFGVSNCAGIPRQTEQCIHLYNNNVDKGGVDGSPILSTRFVNVTWVSISTDAQNEGVAWYPSGYNHTFYIYLNKTRIDMTADDTTATLATKCNAYIQTLTGREVYYQLLTPVTTDITSLQQWDAMPQVSGTVTLTLSAEVDPSGAEAVYTATKRPKAQAALIEENTIPEEPAETQVSDTDINTEIIMMED